MDTPATSGPLTRRAIIVLALPVVFAQAATALTGVVDTGIMGYFGDKVMLAAVAVAATVFSFLYWGFGFLRMATTGLTAQAQGAKDSNEVRAVLHRALLTGAGLGVLLAALFPLYREPVLGFFELEPETRDGALGYMDARIWGAPAVLMGYAIMGWLLGRGRTRELLAFQVVLNLVNAGLDTWFVAGLGWGPAGIGAGTAIAEWAALFFGLWLVRDGLQPAAGLMRRDKLLALFNANRDIMVRTLALLFAFAWFVRSGSQVSTAVLAGNEVLLQFIAVSAFVLDAFAFTTEAETGAGVGARDPQRVWRAFRLTSEFALASGAVFAAFYLAIGDDIIRFAIQDPDARQAALDFLPWCSAVPVLGVAAWQLDGLFIGATRGRDLRNAAIVTAVVYVATDIWLSGSFGNHGVWAAFLMMYVYRALALAVCLPGLISDIRSLQIRSTSPGPS